MTADCKRGSVATCLLRLKLVYHFGDRATRGKQTYTEDSSGGSRWRSYRQRGCRRRRRRADLLGDEGDKRQALDTGVTYEGCRDVIKLPNTGAGPKLKADTTGGLERNAVANNYSCGVTGATKGVGNPMLRILRESKTRVS
eukprot:IDg21374t1